ncbi:uncharacterized protein EV420DRAFT_1483303 [Desarmillaria tabescens]|uniref:Uncharacterized protein n=1 Tax=Armillaria tabescens TaxID=1929756 RepID=A0AA39JTZ8_ARMTA|nr:uncharacterized protein EV420DRAFT_1483303 [Desarmillaria tabescens]KAK0448882.1 hypothetical protein EV420DRAFT_1483303 [Desarmillaria tabescens]
MNTRIRLQQRDVLTKDQTEHPNLKILRRSGIVSTRFWQAEYDAVEVSLHPSESSPVTENKDARYQDDVPHLILFGDRLKTTIGCRPTKSLKNRAYQTRVVDKRRRQYLSTVGKRDLTLRPINDSHGLRVFVQVTLIAKIFDPGYFSDEHSAYNENVILWRPLQLERCFSDKEDCPVRSEVDLDNVRGVLADLEKVEPADPMKKLKNLAYWEEVVNKQGRSFFYLERKYSGITLVDTKPPTAQSLPPHATQGIEGDKSIDRRLPLPSLPTSSRRHPAIAQVAPLSDEYSSLSDLLTLLNISVSQEVEAYCRLRAHTTHILSIGEGILCSRPCKERNGYHRRPLAEDAPTDDVVWSFAKKGYPVGFANPTEQLGVSDECTSSMLEEINLTAAFRIRDLYGPDIACVFLDVKDTQ